MVHSIREFEMGNLIIFEDIGAYESEVGVNPDHVTCVAHDDGAGMTVITLIDGKKYHIQESVKEAVAKLNQTSAREG